MNSRSLLCLLAATLPTGFLSKAALADTLTLTTVSATPAGGTLAVNGTFTNTGGGLEYLNADAFTVNAPGITLDDTPYDNGAISVAAGTSLTEEFFTLALPAATAVGSYGGSFVILGGPLNFTSENTLASSSFAVNVTNAAAVTPEPSTWLLLGTGVLGMAFTLRRRQTLAIASPLA